MLPTSSRLRRSRASNRGFPLGPAFFRLILTSPENDQTEKLKHGHGRGRHVGKSGGVQDLSGLSRLLADQVAAGLEGGHGAARSVELHRQGHHLEQDSGGEEDYAGVHQAGRLEKEAETREKETLRLSLKVTDLSRLLSKIAEVEGLEEQELRSGRRKKRVVMARKIFCQLAVKKMGYSGATVARFLGVTTSAVNRMAALEEVKNLEEYL